MNRLPFFLLAFLAGRILAFSQAPQSTAVAGSSLDVDLYGNIYVVNAEENTVKLLGPNRQVLAEIGGGGWENSRFDRPAGIWARNGIDIYVADYGNHRVQRFDRGLSFVNSLSTRESSDPGQRFGFPSDVALSRMGELFICDTENQRVVKVGSQNAVELSLGGFDAGKGRLHNPTRIAIGPSDNVYVLDGSRILVFDLFGNFLHELYDTMWKQPSALYADENRVLVADQGALYCFDRQERPSGNVALADIVPGLRGEVRSIGAHQGKLYLLSTSGLATVADPCWSADHIDK